MIREEELENRTFKGSETVGQRVFYTLRDNEETALHRTQKAVSLLYDKLHSSGALSESELDELLLEVIH